MDAATLELVKLIGGGVGLGVFAAYVALQLRDQTRLLVSINRKQARIEAVTTGRPAPRDPRARTAPLGVPIDPRSRADSDEPPIALSRTTTDEDVR